MPVMPVMPPGGELFAALLIFVRVGGAIAVLPGFSAGYVPVRPRLLLALAISVLLLPTLAPTLPPLPERPDALLLLLLGETLIGLFLGSVPRLLFSALQVAGTFIAFRVAYTGAYLQDLATARSLLWMGGISCVIAIFFVAAFAR